jgi:beta-glucuronidase
MFVFRDFIKKPEDEASQYVDFVSANIYGDHFTLLERIHALYPNKPVYISEFGLRADHVKSEDERVDHLRRAMQSFRKCDYLIGASVWTFNDYQSMFPGSNVNGYRPWGLVTPEREPRKMYDVWKEEFSPATVEVADDEDGLNVTVTARKDFPSYTLRNYKLNIGNQSFVVPVLKPGESKQFTIDLKNHGLAGAKVIELVKPGDFVIWRKEVRP